MTEPSELDSSSTGGSSASQERSVSDDGRRNLALTVAYDGTDYRGLAESVGVPTVLGELRRTLEQVLRVRLDLTAAGRTDAGVHGWGQVVTGRFPADIDHERLQRSVNRMCAPGIAVRRLEWVDDSFDARFSATSRAYRYDVWSHPHPNPLVARVAWHVPHPLDIDAMNAAATTLIGQHDFSSFCRRPKVTGGRPEKSLVRILQIAEWERVPTDAVDSSSESPLLRFHVAATSFCHQMVRSIVGTLVEVGRGRVSSDSMTDVLAALDRSAAGPVAPPTGLVLWNVGYDGTRWDA